MHRFFGLEVLYANTARNQEARWPSHKNYRWHDEDDLKTTLCFLTLPKRLASEGLYFPSKRLEIARLQDRLGGAPGLDVAQALQVNLAGLTITEEERRRFQKILMVLSLQPYLHLSQEDDTDRCLPKLSANPTHAEDESSESSTTYVSNDLHANYLQRYQALGHV